MSAVYGLYDDGASAQRAINGLRAAGVATSAITVITGEPLEDHEFFDENKTTRMWYIACAGGLAGLLASTWLTRMTELAWPLQTGNMPIVAWWPNLIVIFEMTMLGAILSAVATLMVTAGLLRKGPPLYDPAVTDGKILVGVQDPAAANLAALERALTAGGALELKRK
jgi:ActD protein